MTWVKLTKQGLYSSTRADEPGQGVWIASMTMPYCDGTTTAFYYAIDGMVMAPPVLCHHGQARAMALAEAVKESKRYPN